MTIKLKLSKQQAERLKARAAQQGRSVEDYLIDLAERESREGWQARLKALPQLLPDDLPALPDHALQREALYKE
jgi:hypothetical protein